MRSDLPKVLQPLAGKPLLAHVLDCARGLGADDICVVYGHGAEDVLSAFPDDSLRWALQAQQLGTGHAVQQAMPDTPDNNQVLILFGDVPLLRKETLQTLTDAMGKDELAVLTVDMDDPTGYGRILREGGRVLGNVEEKDATEEQKAIVEINTGVMLCGGARLNII
jgi:bifunctional UDP-N-acetylglucosamine pyrophosphorylase/glucosamine-1-phosphate N-acetyltransferase